MKYGTYKTLTKDEQKALKKAYYNTLKGVDMQKRFNRIKFYIFFFLTIGVVSIILEMLSIIEWYMCFASIALLICGISFSIGLYNIQMQQYCLYINKIQKRNKKIK